MFFFCFSNFKKRVHYKLHSSDFSSVVAWSSQLPFTSQKENESNKIRKAGGVVGSVSMVEYP